MLSGAQSHSELQINADSINISQKITKEINMLKVFIIHKLGIVLIIITFHSTWTNSSHEGL